MEANELSHPLIKKKRVDRLVYGKSDKKRYKLDHKGIQAVSFVLGAYVLFSCACFHFISTEYLFPVVQIIRVESEPKY
jgi:hypothetical protein